jgi:outer membrane lipoprotein LolB
MTRVLALLAVLLVGGCATIETQYDGLSLAARLERIEQETVWQMRGRIAVDTGDDAYQGRFTWWQDGDAMRVNIRGPLGVGAVEISGTEDDLTLRARGDQWRLEDAEVQLSELLGWWLPITSLPHWLLGSPDPRFDTGARQIDDERLTRLAQRSWSVRFSRYGLANGILTPQRIEFEHADLALLVSIDSWDTESALAVKP